MKRRVLIGVVLSSMIFCQSVLAQLVERSDMTFIGKYEVKMISSQILQAVWLSSTSPYKAIRPMTDDEMAEYYTSINNRLYVGSYDFDYALAYIPTVPVNAVGFSQIYADCDEDTTTWQSSAAYLDYGSDKSCAEVYKAYLYWNVHDASSVLTYDEHINVCPTLRSMPAHSNEGIGGVAYKTVMFKAPGDVTYTDVTADRILDDGLGERKICFADVTDKVKGKGNGLYWLANVHSGTGKGAGGATAGWTLVIVYSDSSAPYRTVKFWDGLVNINQGSINSLSFSFSNGQVPALGNPISYLGLGVLDGENIASLLANMGESPEFLDVYSTSATDTSAVYKINPFAPGQTAPNEGEPQAGYPTYIKGVLNPESYDGVSCSRISTFDPDLGSNGNAITRIPNQRNTLGYDAHFFKLPAGAIIPQATSFTMKYYAGPQGGTSPFLAFMAIESSRPILNLKLRTEGEKVTTLGEEITYVLTVENVGSSALAEGAYVLDTLDATVDFVSSSVEYVNKTAPASFEIYNQGADENEELKLYLPALDAGDGITATDSAVIKFKVRVEDLSRMDIWSLICNRVVRNSAIAYYENSNGNEFTAVANTPIGCGVSPDYLEVFIEDTTLTQYQTQTHYVSDSIYSHLLAAEKLGSPVKTKSFVLQYLAEKLVELGRAVSDTSYYTIIDENGLEVSAASVFALDESNQNFKAEANLGQGCVETFYFEFVVAPKILGLVVQSPICIGASDGKISFSVLGGIPRYTCLVVDSLNESNIIYQAVAATDDSVANFEITNLTAGSYKIYVGDQGQVTATKVVKIVNPLPISVSISAQDTMCYGMPATMTAYVSGRDGMSLDYVWESSIDSVNWTPIFENSSSFDETITDAKYYAVYVCDNNCMAYDVVKVEVDMTSGCVPASTEELINTPKALIYPNPAKDGFVIKTGKVHNTMNLYDINGKLFMNKELSDGVFTNVSSLPQGSYVVELNGEKIKLIKQ